MAIAWQFPEMASFSDAVSAGGFVTSFFSRGKLFTRRHRALCPSYGVPDESVQIVVEIGLRFVDALTPRLAALGPGGFIQQSAACPFNEIIRLWPSNSGRELLDPFGLQVRLY